MADRSVSVFLRANVSGYLASIEKAKLSTRDFAKSAAVDAKAHSAAYDKVGKSMLITGGVIAAGIGLAIKASMEFRAQMAQVQSLSGATASQMKQLADAALTVGQRFGFTAKQVAEAETELVKAGLSVKDILGGALTGALTLAADGQMNVADATQIAVSAMTQFKLTGKDVPHIADLLAAGADKALGSVGDLGEGLASSGTVAHQFGWSLQETVGTLSEFAQNAQIGEKGGTLLRQTLLRLVGAQGVAKAMMDKYGFSILGANGQMVSSSELAGRLQKSFGGLTPAVRNHALAVIFGTHAIQGANILMSDGAKVNANWVTTVNDAGFAAKQAAGKMDSLSGDLSKLKASFETGLIETGDAATGTLRGLTQALTKVTGWYDHLSDSSRSLVTQLALVVGGLTLAGGAALVALPKIVAFREALATLGITGRGAAGGLTAVTTAEAGAGAAGAAGAGGAAAGGGAGLFAKIGGAGLAGAGLMKTLPLYTVGANSDTLKGPVQRAMDNFSAEHPGAGSKGFNAFVSSAATSKAAAAQLKAYEQENYKVKSSADAAATASAKAAAATAAAGGAAGHAAMSVDDYATALKDANQPALDARGAARAYQQALDDATASLKSNGRTLDNGTNKGRANAAALDGIAASALAAAEANRANGVSQAKTNTQLDAARTSLYDMARKFGMSEKAAHAYVNRVLTIPAAAATKVSAPGLTEAQRRLQTYHDLFNNIPANVLTTVTVGGIAKSTAQINALIKKEGAAQFYAGQKQATGGSIYGPGTGTSDSIPIWASKGEYVINAASAARIGIENLHALNHFAGGGSVGQQGGMSMSSWSMPEYVTLVDSDGSFIARMRTEAGGVTRGALKAQNRQIASGVRS